MKTKSIRYTSVWLAALALAGSCEQLSAVDYHVANAQELQTALAHAAASSVNNNIYVTNGYYGGNFNYSSTDVNDLTLLAEPGVSNTQITIDGGGTGSSMFISGSATAKITVRGMTFLRNCGSTSLGALQIAGGNTAILVDACLFLSPINSSGIGLELVSGLNATVTNCTAVGSPNAVGGTGIYISSITNNVTVQNCTMATNNDPDRNAGGLYVSGAGVVAVTDCVFTSNSEPNSSGGGAYCNDQTVAFSGNAFTGNSAQYDGGAVSCNVSGNNGAVTLSSNTFTSNSVGYDGGGGAFFQVGGNNGAVTLSSNTFTGNSLNYDGYGGGAYCDVRDNNDAVTLSGNTFTGNSANNGSYGGGYAFLSRYTTTLNLSGNTFTGNSASVGDGYDSRGGGAYCYSTDSSTMTVSANTFQGNTVVNPSQYNLTASGGGLYASGPTVNLLDNLVVNNTLTSTGSQGGGIWVDASATLNMINNTVTGNASAGSGGGVAYVVTGTVELLNVYDNIIWGNLASVSGGDVYLAGTGEEKVFSNNDADNIYGVWDVFTNNLDIDPQFVDSTNGNYHLVSRSPCIDAGTTSAPSLPLTDLDGNPRIVGGTIDLGCYEFDSVPILLSIQPSPTNGVLLQWPSVAGVNYAVQKSTDLSKGFSDVTSSLPNTAPVNSYTDVPAPGTPAAFYRIRSW